MDKKTLQDVLNTALGMEEKGHKFYKEVSQISKNNIARKTFGFLADNELLHIESIKSFYNSLKEKGDFPELELDRTGKERMDDLNIFSRNMKEMKAKVKPSEDDKKACEFAMEFENSGYKYYEDMLKAAKDEKLARLLKFLLAEEKKHYESIMDLHSYLTDSQNWFMYEEGSFPQG
ncbi:MAG: ferritin family protein [Candidatus Omnitrophica bacterium]|nr:ferritin family protein [Candidatus Omnitrophota bacterium]